MLSFTSKEDPEGKAAALLALLTEAYFTLLYAISKLFNVNINLKNLYVQLITGGICLLLILANYYLFTRNKFHRKNFTYFEKERLLRSFWKEELVFYLFISVWLIGMVIFTAIENPGFKR